MAVYLMLVAQLAEVLAVQPVGHTKSLQFQPVSPGKVMTGVRVRVPAAVVVVVLVRSVVTQRARLVALVARVALIP